MLLATVFDQFVQDSPLSVMARALLEHALGPGPLDEMFERIAKVQYTDKLLFSTVVDMMGLVVCGFHKSPHAVYLSRRELFPVALTNVYEKLNGIELPVMRQLVLDNAARLTAVVEATGGALPELLPGFRVKILDGNCLAGTQHRIKELRDIAAAPLPGKTLVVLDPQLGLVTDVFPCEDGHAQERALLGPVLDSVQPGELWIEDRNFCTLGLLFGMARRGAAFVVRQHGQLQGELVGRRTRQGTTRSGAVYEQSMLVRAPDSGETMRVRRLTLKLQEPTRDGDTEIHILSNVPTPRASAAHLARLYGKRWSIETAFFEITTTLACEINTLGYPKAALFTFCLALLAYNAVSLIKAALRSAHGRQKIHAEVSSYYLALEISRTYDGMMIAIPALHWAFFRELAVQAFAEVLRELASAVNLSKYQKHPRSPKKKPPERTAYQNGKHVSTAKLLAQR
jgi:Transposase DDE domain